MEDILVVIPARGGSKGLPGKNIKNLCGKPLIAYSIDVARAITIDDNICVSTDDQKIIDVVEKYGLHVPFVRPAELASDTASTNDVLLHAVKGGGKLPQPIISTFFKVHLSLFSLLIFFIVHFPSSTLSILETVQLVCAVYALTTSQLTT